MGQQRHMRGISNKRTWSLRIVRVEFPRQKGDGSHLEKEYTGVKEGLCAVSVRAGRMHRSDLRLCRKSSEYSGGIEIVVVCLQSSWLLCFVGARSASAS